MSYRDESTYAYILKLIIESDARTPQNIREECSTLLRAHKRTESGLHNFLLDITGRPREEVGGFVRAFRPNVSKTQTPEKTDRSEEHNGEAHRRTHR